MVLYSIWPRNHTSHKKFYFNEFVANAMRDVIGIVIFDLHGSCQRPHTIQRPHTLALWDGPNVELKCQSVRLLYKYAYVITEYICNKFIEVNFFVRCMVSWPNHLFKVLTPMSLINKTAPQPPAPCPTGSYGPAHCQRYSGVFGSSS